VIAAWAKKDGCVLDLDFAKGSAETELGESNSAEEGIDQRRRIPSRQIKAPASQIVVPSLPMHQLLFI
jgi:hypothetical protein